MLLSNIIPQGCDGHSDFGLFWAVRLKLGGFYFLEAGEEVAEFGAAGAVLG